jgi:hypothetical protein
LRETATIRCTNIVNKEVDVERIWKNYLSNVQKFLSGSSVDADEKVMQEFEDAAGVKDRYGYRTQISLVSRSKNFHWLLNNTIRNALLKVKRGRVGTLAASG